MNNNKKIIFAIFLLTVFFMGLTIAQSVSAEGTYYVDKGEFTIKNKKISYVAWRYDKYFRLLTIYFTGNDVPQKYKITELWTKNKNHIELYSTNGYKETLLKTYKSNKNVDSFYKSYYKNYIINQVKKSIK